MLESSRVAAQVAASQEGLSSMKLVFKRLHSFGASSVEIKHK
jgi:hypothetical protein